MNINLKLIDFYYRVYLIKLFSLFFLFLIKVKFIIYIKNHVKFL